MGYHLKKDEIACRKIGDEFFVLTLGDSTLHNVKGAGVRIMELLEEGKGEDEILQRLGEEFEAPAAEMEADLAAFLKELETKGIIARNEG